jgi:hypothetical protein
MWLYAWDAIGHPFQLDPTESKLLQQALWLRQGEPIHFALGPEPPWVVGNYPPLYPWLCSLGVDPETPEFAWPRALTLIGTITAGLAMAALLWRATRSVALALLGPGLWWSTYEVYWYASLCRVDLAALALSTGGLVVGLASLGRWNWPRLIAACALFWLAWLTRQTQILLPLALLLQLAWTDRRWAWRFGLLWIGGLAALLASLTIATRGAFWVGVFWYNVNAWDLWQFEIWLRHLALRMWPAGVTALAVAAAGAIAWGRTKDGTREPLGEALGVMTTALGLNLLNLVLTGKVGADKNYLLEPLWCLSALLVLLWLHWAARAERVSDRPLARVISAVLTALLVVQVLWSVTNPLMPQPSWRDGLWPNRHHWRPRITQSQLREDLAIQQAVEEAAGPVLCEYGIYVLRAGRELIHEPFLMSQLAKEERWDESPLLRRIRGGEFAVILTADDLAKPEADDLHQSATAEFAAAVRDHCVQERVFNGSARMSLWRPRRSPGDLNRPAMRLPDEFDQEPG